MRGLRWGRWPLTLALLVALMTTSGCHLVANAYAIPRLDNIMPRPADWDEAEYQCFARATTGACQAWAVAEPVDEESAPPPGQ